jgi:hypothetical protein
LSLFKTYDKYTWTLKANNFKIGDKDINAKDNGQRFVSLEPQLPYLYLPEADFEAFTTQVHKIYDKWFNIRQKKKKCGDTVCKFDTKCSEVDKKDVNF